MSKQMKQLLAEFLGTFTLVFVGAFAVVNASAGGVVVPALAHGLVLVGLIFTFGHLSGAQFNPAVTLGLLIGGKMKPVDSAMYMLAQFSGGILAAFTLVALIGMSNTGETTGSLTAGNPWGAAIFEAILTFFLVSAVYQSAVYGKAGNVAAIAIGFTLAASILAGGPFTGASLNPARTLGPAIAGGHFDYLVPYMIGIFAGGAIGGVVHGIILKEN